MSVRFFTLAEVAIFLGCSREDLYLHALQRTHGWRYVRKAWRIAPAKLKRFYKLPRRELDLFSTSVSKSQDREPRNHDRMARVANLLDHGL